MNKKAFYDLISVLGAVILFSAWIFQQFALERTNTALHRIDSAEEAYRTYQSNNALFNAIIAAGQDNTEIGQKVRRFQTYNYSLGLSKLAELTDTEKIEGYDIPMEQMQRYLEEVQRKATNMRKEIETRRDRFNFIFLLIYSSGSLLVLLGNLLKLWLPSGD